MTQITRFTLDEDGTGTRRLKETKTDLEAPLETVGQDLRSARLARGEDLANVSSVLKIRKEHLEALEGDKIELLPGRTYAVGFIRSYARYLGLDPVAYVDRFKAEIAGRNEISPPPVTVIDEDEHKKLPQGWWAIAGVVLLLVLYGAYQLMAAADKAMREQVSEPPSAEASAPPIPKAIKIVPPQPTAEETASEQPATADGTTPGGATAQGQVPGQVPGQIQGAPGSPQGAGQSAQAALGPNGQPLPVQQVPKPAMQNPPPLPQGEVFGVQNKNPHVILRALQATRVLVEGPGDKIYILKILKPGDIYQVPNLPGLKLTVANSNALDLILDGQYLGRIGRTPDSLEALPLDAEGLAKRYRH